MHCFTLKHQTDVSEIHSTPLNVLVNATTSGGLNIPLSTASSIWYDVINPAEWFIISIMSICMCKVDILLTIHTTLLLKNI